MAEKEEIMEKLRYREEKYKKVKSKIKGENEQIIRLMETL
jgi:hypothetical protein